MRLSVLASGSKGNCTYIKTDNIEVLIDLGMSCLYIEKCLCDLGVDPKNIQSVFLTHTHIDHIAGLKVFIKKYNPTIYLTNKMYKELIKIINLSNYQIIDGNFEVNDLYITPFKTSHDTDSLGFILKNNDKEVVYITDTGYINVKNHKLLKDKDLYIIESNYDINMLMDNPNYPYHTKQRILSDKGHLSNYDSAKYVSKFISDRTKKIILIHLSENNNKETIAFETMNNKLNNFKGEIIISRQNERTELIEV